MDESSFLRKVETTFRSVTRAFDELDPDTAEAITTTEGVISIVFGSGIRCVLNSQRPTRQLWLACQDTAWHFTWNDANQRWNDDKGRGELYTVLADIVQRHAAVTLALTHV